MYAGIVPEIRPPWPPSKSLWSYYLAFILPFNTIKSEIPSASQNKQRINAKTTELFSLKSVSLSEILLNYVLFKEIERSVKYWQVGGCTLDFRRIISYMIRIARIFYNMAPYILSSTIRHDLWQIKWWRILRNSVGDGEPTCKAQRAIE
jgi:hypothetical protein